MPYELHLSQRLRLLAWICLLLGVSAASVARAADVDAADPALADAKCISGMEKFLPANYYYCVAAQSYGAGHYEQAQRLFRQAAAWASKPAQYVLGVMALQGDHQSIDRPLALAWFALAAERRTARFEQAYRELRVQLSPKELRKSDEELQKLMATYADTTAAVRAEARYREGMQSLKHSAGGSSYCLAGQFDLAETSGAGSFSSLVSEAGACDPVEKVSAMIDKQAEHVFEDWGGHVVVGPLRNMVPSPKP